MCWRSCFRRFVHFNEEWNDVIADSQQEAAAPSHEMPKYFDVDELFGRHAVVAEICCREAPISLLSLFTGLVWRSRALDNSTRVAPESLHWPRLALAWGGKQHSPRELLHCAPLGYRGVEVRSNPAVACALLDLTIVRHSIFALLSDLGLPAWPLAPSPVRRLGSPSRTWSSP